MATVLNGKGQKVSTNWSSGPNEYVKCPFPGCGHAGDRITKLHCRLTHNMEREEVGKLYGMATIVEGKGAILSENNGRKWNSVSGTYLI